MTKGFNGLSCREAICRTITKLEVATARDIIAEVKKKGNWTDNTIYRHLLAMTINLQAGYFEYPQMKVEHRCLFLREDGLYERYNPDKHGIFKEGIRIKEG